MWQCYDTLRIPYYNQCIHERLRYSGPGAGTRHVQLCELTKQGSKLMVFCLTSSAARAHQLGPNMQFSVGDKKMKPLHSQKLEAM